MELPPTCGVVSFLTDFGVGDPWVGQMHGQVLRADNQANVVDLAHGVPAQDVSVGAVWWATAIDRFPIGTVHVGVVDPGVGTSRRVIVAVAGGCYWVAPDNGLLSLVLERLGEAEIRAVELERLGLPAPSATFHGRDVFAPIAGLLVARRFGFRALGPRIDDPLTIDVLDGAPRVVFRDRFGNLVTNLGRKQIEGATAVEIHGRRVPIQRTYADVEPGEFLAVINSFDLLEVANRDGHAAEMLDGAGRGTPVKLVR
jgi:S-adenosylmethionine hydrolase